LASSLKSGRFVWKIEILEVIVREIGSKEKNRARRNVAYENERSKKKEAGKN